MISTKVETFPMAVDKLIVDPTLRTIDVECCEYSASLQIRRGSNFIDYERKCSNYRVMGGIY